MARLERQHCEPVPPAPAHLLGSAGHALRRHHGVASEMKSRSEMVTAGHARLCRALSLLPLKVFKWHTFLGLTSLKVSACRGKVGHNAVSGKQILSPFPSENTVLCN